MNRPNRLFARNSKLKNWLCHLVLLSAVGSAGCQVEMGGQTLPSPYYLSDDVQYYAPGPEFKLAREAAALKQLEGEQQLEAAP